MAYYDKDKVNRIIDNAMNGLGSLLDGVDVTVNGHVKNAGEAFRNFNNASFNRPGGNENRKGYEEPMRKDRSPGHSVPPGASESFRNNGHPVHGAYDSHVNNLRHETPFNKPGYNSNVNNRNFTAQSFGSAYNKPVYNSGYRHTTPYTKSGSFENTGFSVALYDDSLKLIEKGRKKRNFGIIMLCAGTFLLIRFLWGLGLISGLFYMLGASILLFKGVSDTVKGIKKIKRAERFKVYLNLLASKTEIKLSELAKATQKSRKYIVKDLENMLENDYFKQGHIEEKDDEFITSNETYELYKTAKEKQSKEIDDEEQREAESPKSEEDEIIIKMEEYRTKINKMNELLPGEVISDKLDKLENFIERIIKEIKKQPEKSGELKKMLSYYLPTTWKLLEVYEEIDSSETKTETMLKTQKEIEESVDTINYAFEKLLDRLFEDKAWDVSSDISVLNMMLAKEGLKDDGLQSKLTNK